MSFSFSSSIAYSTPQRYRHVRPAFVWNAQGIWELQNKRNCDVGPRAAPVAPPSAALSARGRASAKRRGAGGGSEQTKRKRQRTSPAKLSSSKAQQEAAKQAAAEAAALDMSGQSIKNEDLAGFDAIPSSELLSGLWSPDARYPPPLPLPDSRSHAPPMKCRGSPPPPRD